MADEDMRQLLATLTQTLATFTTQSRRTFGQFEARYDGRRDEGALEGFVRAATAFKNREQIADDAALRDLAFLLTDKAATWWNGNSHRANTWENAVEMMRRQFAPPTPPSKLLFQIVGVPQTKGQDTVEFLNGKCELYARLPEAYRISEEFRLDCIYQGMRPEIRERIPRDTVPSMETLIDRVRAYEEAHYAEEPQKEPRNTSDPRRGRCRHCHARGHAYEDCRKRQRDEAAAAVNDQTANGRQQLPKYACYGCGRPGTIRSQCPTCSPKPDNQFTFCTMDCQDAGAMGPRRRPAVAIEVLGDRGVGIIDTGAKVSIAGRPLHDALVRKGIQFEEATAQVTFADGIANEKQVKRERVHVTLEGRTVPVTFIALPGAEDSRTLLGMDFLRDAGIVLDFCGETWWYGDEPTRKFQFRHQGEGSEAPKASLSTTAQQETEQEAEEMDTTPDWDEMAQWYRVLPPLTPLEFAAEVPWPEKLTEIDVRPYWYNEVEELRRQAELEVSGIDLFPPLVRPLPIDYVTCSTSNLREEEGVRLDDAQRRKFNHLLDEFRDVFAEKGPPTTLACHYIKTQELRPIATPPYRLSPTKQAALGQEVKRLLADGILETSEGAWCAPAVMVPKSDGSWRLCIDYRKLNAVTIPDVYPLPRMDDLLQDIKHTAFMSTMDLRSGYWQVPVAPEDQEKTAFVCHLGAFRFTRMPFGLRNAPSTFQRLIDRIRRTLPHITMWAYLDDLVLASDTFEGHLRDLKTLFQRFREGNLRLHREKCHFHRPEVHYLGHIITARGVATNPEKTRALQARPPPRNLKELRSFIQAASWFRRYIPAFSELARPLTALTKKDAKWTWGAAQQTAFHALKDALTSPPILTQADPGRPFILRTDASQYALGAALLQGEPPEERPIEYASRLLSKAERNYTTTEREALAIVWSISKFRGYLDEQSLVVITDHQPLKWLMSLASPNGRLARWALLIQHFRLTVTYAPGKANALADALSRPPIEDEAWDLAPVQVDFKSRGAQETRAGQLQCDQLRPILEDLQSGDDSRARRWSDRGYLINQGVLFRLPPDHDTEEPLLVIPQQERQEILREYHDTPTSGHGGVNKTIARITAKYTWPTLWRNVGEFIRNCKVCRQYKASNLVPAGLIQTPPMNKRFETVSFDLVGPLPVTPRGNRWILVVEDTASRWVELFPLPEATAHHCARILTDEIILRYGTPRRFISDNGTQFVSEIMKSLTKSLNIAHSFTASYHPEANPTERKNRDLKTQLAILSGDNHAAWDQFLPPIRFSLNTGRNEATQQTAAFLTFGRELRDPRDANRDLREVLQNENFITEITPLLQNMVRTLDQARESTELHQDRRKDYGDRRRRPGPRYEPGDKVWVELHLPSNAKTKTTKKLLPRRDGPYVVLKQIGATSYEIAHPGRPTEPVATYHTSALTPYELAAADEVPDIPLRRRGRPRKSPAADPIAGASAGRPSPPEGECSVAP